MTNEQEAFQAFEALIEELLTLGATDLVREIHAAIARGTTRPGKGKKQETITLQAPYSSTEAFAIAVRHVLAALDPIFMVRQARPRLAGLEDEPDGEVPEIIWAFDKLFTQEGTSVPLPETDDYIEPLRELPKVDLDGYKALEANAAKVARLCDQLLSELESV